MSAEDEIDDLLRQDEAELKAKRKRLKTFATAVDDMRASQLSAAALAEELVASGDLTRAEIGKVFKLSRPEKSLLLPARRVSTGDAEPEKTNAVADQTGEPENGNENPEKDNPDSQEN